MTDLYRFLKFWRSICFDVLVNGRSSLRRLYLICRVFLLLLSVTQFLLKKFVAIVVIDIVVVLVNAIRIVLGFLVSLSVLSVRAVCVFVYQWSNQLSFVLLTHWIDTVSEDNILTPSASISCHIVVYETKNDREKRTRIGLFVWMISQRKLKKKLVITNVPFCPLWWQFDLNLQTCLAHLKSIEIGKTIIVNSVAVLHLPIFRQFNGLL